MLKLCHHITNQSEFLQCLVEAYVNTGARDYNLFYLNVKAKIITADRIIEGFGEIHRLCGGAKGIIERLRDGEPPFGVIRLEHMMDPENEEILDEFTKMKWSDAYNSLEMPDEEDINTICKQFAFTN